MLHPLDFLLKKYTGAIQSCLQNEGENCRLTKNWVEIDLGEAGFQNYEKQTMKISIILDKNATFYILTIPRFFSPVF